MLRHLRKMMIGAVAIVAVVGAHSIFGQQAVSLQGVVKNSSGAPVAGAFVKMKNDERRLTFMVISQDQGRYSINNLPAGKYVVQGIGGDYQSKPSAPVDVAVGRPASADV